LVALIGPATNGTFPPEVIRSGAVSVESAQRNSAPEGTVPEQVPVAIPSNAAVPVNHAEAGGLEPVATLGVVKGKLVAKVVPLSVSLELMMLFAPLATGSVLVVRLVLVVLPLPLAV
jgi:hypothetical protein